MVCPLCLPSGERRGGYLLPSAMLAASVEEDQAATGCACDASCIARVWFVVVGETRRGVALTGCGFRLADVVPQWQRPVVVRRAGADSDGSSDDESDDETTRRRHVAGWLCNHFQEHFQPRRGGGAHEQKRYDHHRGVMQRRWLPTAEVDRCRPADSGERGPSAAAGGTMLAVEVLAGGLLEAIEEELEEDGEPASRTIVAGIWAAFFQERQQSSCGQDCETAVLLCKRANAIGVTVGRQHWLTNRALGLLARRGVGDVEGSLFALFCWMTIWLQLSPVAA